MKPKKKQILFVVVLVLLVVGFLEAVLRLLAFVSPRVDRFLTSAQISVDVPDARLGYRPNPAYPGHDRQGFRNVDIPAKAHIVALGDSQTYGAGVNPEDTWPRQLESLTGKIVYNMAFGGYGPTHSLALWDEAVTLSPTIVIEAFYFGNDLHDSFHFVYNNGQLTELKSSDPQVQTSVREAERSAPLAHRGQQLFQMCAQTAAVAGVVTTGARDGSSPVRFFSKYSRIYTIFHRAYQRVRLMTRLNTPQDEWERAKSIAEANPAYCEVFSDGQSKTIFTSEYRLVALNLGDPRIAEGLQISLKAIQRMHELAATRKIRFFVVLIPTKETVFRRLWGNPSESFRRNIENEERALNITKDFLVRNHIEYLEALPALQEQLMTGVQPYQVSQDGHPNEHGHRAITKLVATYLESSKISQAQAK
jgi:lysophospholipase L1-like esterase